MYLEKAAKRIFWTKYIVIELQKQNLKLYSQGKYAYEFKFILSILYCILPHGLCDVHNPVSMMK